MPHFPPLDEQLAGAATGEDGLPLLSLGGKGGTQSIGGPGGGTAAIVQDSSLSMLKVSVLLNLLAALATAPLIALVTFSRRVAPAS